MKTPLTQLLLALCVMAMSMGPARAEDQFLMEDNAVSHFQRGQMWMGVEDYPAAIREYQLAILLKPSAPMSAAIYNDLARAYQRVGVMDKAIVAYQQAIQLNPHFSLYYENLAQVYRDSGSWQSAVNTLTEKTQASPSDLSAWYLLGQVQRLADNPEAALYAFKRCQTIAPRSELAIAARHFVDRLSPASSR